MDLERLAWDEAILEELRIPRAMLPEIRGSSEVYGDGDRRPRRRPHRRRSRRPAGGPLRTDLLRGRPGQVHVRHRLLHAHAHRGAAGPLAPRPDHHRGGPPRAGRGPRRPTRWRDPWPSPARSSSGSATTSASSATRPRWSRSPPASPTAADVVFVPAFSGLFAPHWRSDARGVIAGLTRYATKAHIARAALEATAYQVLRPRPAMAADLGAALPGELRVDGGMIRNELLMQFQADILGRAGRGAADRGDERARRRLRGRSGRRFLDGPRRAPRDGPGGASLGARDGRRPTGPRASRAGTRASSGPWAGSTDRDGPLDGRGLVPAAALVIAVVLSACRRPGSDRW